MTNFIKAIATATEHNYKGQAKNGAAIKAAAEEGKRSTDLMAPTTDGSTCTEPQWAALLTAAAKGLTAAQFKVWQTARDSETRYKKGSKEAEINRRACTAINDTVKCVRRGIERLEKAAAKAEAKANGTEVEAKTPADNHDKAIKMLSSLNDFLKKHLSEGSSVETHKLASLMQKVIIADTKNTAEVPH
tara:strand:- start:668 stop:1234 length:567 start_codon:yes stop_codon:yes gene_type:complete